MIKIGIIGERSNIISYSMLENSLKCSNVEVLWFIDAKLPLNIKEKLYGKQFHYGVLFYLINKIKIAIAFFFKKRIDCKKRCKEENIKYIVPKKLSINNGLPDEMYDFPAVDYVLICGCDQILNAKSFERQGFAKVLEEEEISSNDFFVDAVYDLFNNRSVYIDRIGNSSVKDGVDKVTRVITESFS